MIFDPTITSCHGFKTSDERFWNTKEEATLHILHTEILLNERNLRYLIESNRYKDSIELNVSSFLNDELTVGTMLGYASARMALQDWLIHHPQP